MKKRLVFILCTVLAVLMNFTSVLAQTASGGNSEGGPLQRPEPRIDDTRSVWCDQNNDEGTINGDNNWFGETIRVTNRSPFPIFCNVFDGNDNLIDGADLDVGDTFDFDVEFDQGKYYFKVSFIDPSDFGLVTLRLRTL